MPHPTPAPDPLEIRLSQTLRDRASTYAPGSRYRVLLMDLATRADLLEQRNHRLTLELHDAWHQVGQLKAQIEGAATATTETPQS